MKKKGIKFYLLDPYSPKMLGYEFRWPFNVIHLRAPQRKDAREFVAHDWGELLDPCLEAFCTIIGDKTPESTIDWSEARKELLNPSQAPEKANQRDPFPYLPPLQRIHIEDLFGVLTQMCSHFPFDKEHVFWVLDLIEKIAGFATETGARCLKTPYLMDHRLKKAVVTGRNPLRHEMSKQMKPLYKYWREHDNEDSIERVLRRAPPEILEELVKPIEWYKICDNFRNKRKRDLEKEKKAKARRAPAPNER